jgi:glucose/arabinose dehydrogenase
MAFLDPNDILVLENHKGTVQRIINGVKLAQPLLDVNAAVHDGLLGIDIAKNVTLNGSQARTFVFLYYTEAKNEDHEDDNHTIGNRLYRYELADNGSRLVNPKLLLDLPSGPTHNGGAIAIGPDKKLYVAVGELAYGDRLPPLKNKALNYNDGSEPNGVSGILRVTMDGHPAGTILGNVSPLNLYYGYGIRNSFGMDFDPLTKKLWITDNGPDFGDEIDLVEPGFNGGWAYISGMMPMAYDSNYEGYPLPTSLVDFHGKAKYSAPKFTGNHTVGPTALRFMTSDKYGKEYENDMFVGDVNNGRIYHFDLNQNRTELNLTGPLAKKVATSDEQLQGLIFAKGFRSVLPDVTDIKIGPDGYLYVVAMNQGKIFKIVPREPNEPNDEPEELESFMQKVLDMSSEGASVNKYDKP